MHLDPSVELKSKNLCIFNNKTGITVQVWDIYFFQGFSLGPLLHCHRAPLLAQYQ